MTGEPGAGGEMKHSETGDAVTDKEYHQRGQDIDETMYGRQEIRIKMGKNQK